MTIPKEIAEKFIAWTKKKILHHVQDNSECGDETSELYFHEGQVWWTALGKNIGFEFDGKTELFHRPALIVKRYNDHMCFILPLTTQIKEPKVWYQIPIPGGNKERVANITQGRTISTKRLLRKESSIERDDFQKVKKAFLKQFV